jgi:iron complex transport system substrate-binding protein
MSGTSTLMRPSVPSPIRLDPIDEATRREFLGVFGSAGVGIALSGCADDRVDDAAAGKTRSFTDAFGTVVKIPVDPARIVTTHDQAALLPLLELGVTPVGSAGLINESGAESFRRTQDYDTSGVTHVGAYGEPILEEVIALDPDLIVGGRGDGELAARLRTIAPFVAIDTAGRERINGLLSFGDLVNQVEKSRAFHAQYLKRADTLKRKLRTRRRGMTVSILRALTPSTFEVKDSVIAPVQVDLGLTRPAAQLGIDLYDGGDELSIEVLPQHDADVVLLVDYQGESSEVPFNEVLGSPLWQQLEAAKRGQVFMLDGTEVVGASWGMMLAALDALEAALLRDGLVFTGYDESHA